MNALLLKDFYTLKKQLGLLALVLLVWGAVPNRFLNVFAAVYGAMLPYTAMAYDEQSHWDRLCAMLPYRARDVVLSKYVLGWLALLVSAAATVLIRALCALVPVLGEPLQPAALLFSLCLGCVILAVSLPLMFRFGSVKGRLVMFFAMFTLFAGVGAISGYSSMESDRFSTAAVLAALAAALVLTAVSVPLSIRFYRCRN